MKYDPLIEPDPQQWLATDEAERMNLIQDYHRRAGVELPNEQVHAAFHAIVENQAAAGDEIPVAQAIRRLMKQGLDRHDAVHAVSHVLAGHLWELTHSDVSPSPDLHDAYLDRVRELTAEEWLNG